MSTTVTSSTSDSVTDLFTNHSGRPVHKWVHYLPVYDRFFAQYKDKPINLLEIGIFYGGSLEMWRKYFTNPSTNIVGVDINAICKRSENVAENIHVYTGAQGNAEFIGSIPYEFDIIIDDGSHIQSDIEASFNVLFPKLRQGGVYFIEDLHTAYWHEYQGGLGRRESFIEKVKGFVDDVNGYHIRGNVKYPNYNTMNIRGLYITDSVVVIEKDDNPVPFAVVKGTV